MPGWIENLFLHAGRGIAKVTCSRLVGAGAGETVTRHVGVDAFGMSGGDLIRLVPYPDRGIGVTGALIELLPRGQVLGIASVRVGKQMIEAAPVLDEINSTPDNTVLGREEAERWVGVELANHRWHGTQSGEPFMRSMQPVNTHADEEDDEGTVDT